MKRASNHPRAELCAPVSVFAEIVGLCIQREKFSSDDLYSLVGFWQELNLSILHPNRAVAMACYNLYMNESFRDSRLAPTDLVHLGYAMAYDLDYLITTDRALREYRMPDEFKLVVKHPNEAMSIFK